MPDTVSISRAQWERQEKRAKRLAGEKAYLQLLVNMMQQLGAIAGLDNVVDAMPRIVMENIGGTNLVLYYFIDQDVYSADLYGNKAHLDAIDDPLVAQVAATRELIEIDDPFADTQMRLETRALHAWTWIFPLTVGSDLVGVFKIANLHISTQEWRNHLPTFFNYAALILKNEILGHSRLQRAYQELQQEVTARRKAEDDLRRSNDELEQKVGERTAQLRQTTEELDQFFTLALDLLCIADTDGHFRRLNPAWERTLGYQREELLATNYLDFVHPDDVPSTLEAMTHLSAKRDVVGFVNRYRCKDGTYRWIEWRSVPTGSLIYAAARDITERKEHEQAMARVAQEWSQAMDAMPDALYLLDTERRLIRANKMFYTLTRTTPQQAVGRHIVALIHPHGEDERCPVCQAQEGKRDAVVTLEADHPDNPTGHPIEVVVKIVRTPDGNPSAILASIRDLTRAREYESALRRLNQSLEQRVDDEVTKNREKDAMLIQQSRLATMGEMMHNVAHQWRQPLSTITLILHNIQDDFRYGELTADGLKKQVDLGFRLAQKMSTTIDDFRDFFRPDHTMTRFNLLDSVREALNLVEASFLNNQIAVSVESDGAVRVNGFANEFSQVLLNVLSNAKDAIRTSGSAGKVTIRVFKRDGDGIVRVRDNGGGIPEQVLPKIFDPYFTTREGGSGIGLYMSRMIMSHMHGRIEARNVDGGAELLLAVPAS